MATYYDEREDLWQRCPYNPRHRFAGRRYLFHIAKCPQRNSPAIRVCPFNAEHRIHVSLLREHLQVCPTGRSIARDAIRESQYKQENNTSFRYNVKSEKSVKYADDGDDWERPDEDQKPLVINGIHRRPSLREILDKHHKNGINPTTFTLQSLTKSEKQQLHAQMLKDAKERIRLQTASTPSLSSSLSPTSSTSSSSLATLSTGSRMSSMSSLKSSSFFPDSEGDDEDYVPLRRPKVLIGIGRGRIKLNHFI